MNKVGIGIIGCGNISDAYLKAIVGFRLPITRLQGKRKLSQNRDAADQAGVRQGLLANSNPQDHALAHLMVKE